MTTLNGTWTQCSNGDAIFSYDCTGPACYGVSDFPDSVCTNNTDSSKVFCTNGIICDGPPLLASNFSLVQVGNSFQQVDTFDIAGDQFVLNDDGVSNSTVSEGQLNGTIVVGNWSTSTNGSKIVPSEGFTSSASSLKGSKLGSGLKFAIMFLLLVQFLPTAFAAFRNVNELAAQPEIERSATTNQFGSLRAQRQEVAVKSTGLLPPPSVELRSISKIYSNHLHPRALSFDKEKFIDAIATGLYKHISKFGQSAGKKIFTPPPAEKCTLSLSPKQPWYKQITHDSFNAMCSAVAFEASLLDAVGKNAFLKPAPLQYAEQACINAARTAIAEFSVELAFMTEGASLAAGLAAILIAEIVCKAGLSLLTDMSVSETLTYVCQKGGDFIPWSEITSQDGLPCSDKGIPVTPGIVPATPPIVPAEVPPDVVAPPQSAGYFTYSELVNFPCATNAMTTLISAGAAGNPLPYGRRLAEALCNGLQNHGDDTSTLCAQVCEDPCITYPNGLEDFMKTYDTPEYYFANVQNKCTPGPAWLLGKCPTTPETQVHCSED